MYLLFMAVSNSSDASLSKRKSFGITPPLDNVSFMIYQVALIVLDCLLFNVSIKVLVLSKL